MKNLIYLSFEILAVISSNYGIHCDPDNTRTQIIDIPEDAYLDTHHLISKYKYKAETHYVKTEDDYILCVHRIAKPGGIPFFLFHGLLDHSGTYILLGPSKALGYYLSDLGFDVWMGNARGNRYSRNHTKLNPDIDNTFWDFSLNEIGIYDLPAMIDYVLNVTKREKLFYVGHSQGTTTFFIMCAKRPEYNDKINLMHALAPSAYFNHFSSPLSFIATNFIKSSVSNEFKEFLPHRSTVYSTICKLTGTFCFELLSLIGGRNYPHFNMTALPVFFGHFPAGSSMKQIRQYYQFFETKRFAEYDYGSDGNLKKYSTKLSPKYNITNIVAPIALYYGANDRLSFPKDVKKLERELKNVKSSYLIPLKEWTHFDFLYNDYAKKLIYKKIAEFAFNSNS